MDDYAFPTKDLDRGMSLRDYFAAQAMQGLLAGLWHSKERKVLPTTGNRMLVEDAYEIADAMLWQRKQ